MEHSKHTIKKLNTLLTIIRNEGLCLSHVAFFHSLFVQYGYQKQAKTV